MLFVSILDNIAIKRKYVLMSDFAAKIKRSEESVNYLLKQGKGLYEKTVTRGEN